MDLNVSSQKDIWAQYNICIVCHVQLHFTRSIYIEDFILSSSLFFQRKEIIKTNECKEVC